MADLKQIKKLRELTGAGMMDCQRALTEAGDDMDKAVEILRKKGEKIASKKAERKANEGVISLSEKEDKLAVIILNCETDFVAKNKDFIATAQELANKLLELGAEKFSVWAEDKIKNELIVKIGENIQLNKFEIISGDILGYYLHANNKVASVVNLNKGNQELAREIAMHVTAMNPTYLKPEDVPGDVVNKEKEIYQEQLKAEGKPEEIIQKIIQGKLNKFYQENCLIKQAHIKDDKKSIENLLEEARAEIESFQRFEI